MHEQMLSGDHELVSETKKIIKKRLKKIKEIKKEVFKEKFDFTIDEVVENDPEKRDFPKNEKELAEIWRKSLKQATLTRFISLKETEKDRLEKLKGNKEKDKNKKVEKTKEAKQDKKLAKESDAKSEKPATEAELITKAHEAIDKQYDKFLTRLEEDAETEYQVTFFNSVAGIFDPHTSYLPPREKEDFDIDISGSLEGIGAVLQEDGEYIKVVNVVTGGAAWRQEGLEVDDVILAVGQGEEDPVDLVGMRVDDAVRYIRGEKGSEVRLTVRKADGTRKVIPIVRDVVQVGATYAKSSVIKHKQLPWSLGYIKVPKFYRDFGKSDKNVTLDVKTELLRLKNQDVDAVVLDLRSNGGGALEDAKQMSGLFLKGGPVVQIKDHRGNIDILRDDVSKVVYDGPLIVMVNRFSASASEILAGALQDYGRAVIVGGSETHGKGTVQAVLNLNQGPLVSLFGETMGALKVTIQKFYRINGESTQFKGISPDIELPDPFGFSENREKDLDYALKWDTVTPLDYKKWNEFSYNLPLLKDRSEQRVKKDERFKKVRDYVTFLKERRKKTRSTLNLDKMLAEEKQTEEKTKKLKLEGDVNENIEVSLYKDSLKAHEKISKEDESQWMGDFPKRKEEWVTQLREDPAIEETIFILDDILNTQAGKKLTMVKKQSDR
jgi:carboxyl-terminal processing protease